MLCSAATALLVGCVTLQPIAASVAAFKVLYEVAGDREPDQRMRLLFFRNLTQIFRSGYSEPEYS